MDAQEKADRIDEFVVTAVGGEQVRAFVLGEKRNFQNFDKPA